MKTEISRDSHQPAKRYTGVYQQQGRMLTDADWNELVEIIKGQLIEALTDVVGNGTPLHRGLVNNDVTPPVLTWGQVYVEGMRGVVGADGDAASATDFEYLHQNDFPLPPPLPAIPNSYVVYVDVWERTVTQLLDARLRDVALHGADTTTRKQVLAQVKWCSETVDPETDAKNPVLGDAQVSVVLLQASTQPDLCDPCASEVPVESRVGNYLFRLEVHDVKGPANAPEAITLKWSSENGAVQSAVVDGDAPEHFKAGNRAFEFFDDTSESHLGVHLATTTWSPRREALQTTFAVPADPDKPSDCVRRWDGFCTLKKSGSDWTVEQQYGHQEGNSFVTVAGNLVTIELATLRIEVLLGVATVAGDYWLAEVRESVDIPGTLLLDHGAPEGIRHRYLTLGTYVDGVLQLNREADRKYAFPALTELTSMFMAGGDGQEVVPGEALPHPLRVGVANGEQPVIGAQVRFQAIAEDDTPTPLAVVATDEEGIAEYLWTPDDALDAYLKVKATLIDPDNPSGDLNIPPLYFSANLINANQVAYQPQCLPDADEDTVHHLLLGPDATTLGADGYYTVDEVLDALLCELKAAHIPYVDPECAAPSVRHLLGGIDANGDGHITVKDALDTLLCQMQATHIPYQDPDCAAPSVRNLLGTIDANSDGDITVKDALDSLLCVMAAEHIPYNPTPKGSRWDDVNDEEGGGRPATVQDAIDNLVDNLQSEDVKYSLPDCGVATSTLKNYLQPVLAHEVGDAPLQYRTSALWDALLCHLNADTIPLDKTTLCPELKNDPAVSTIQDAINVLCNRKQGGGCCTIVIAEGDNIADKLAGLSGSGKDVHICITQASYSLSEPVTIEGCGHITLAGCGDGSYVEAPNSEAVFIFSGCQSVVVRDISLRAGDLNNKGDGFDHLNGTLTIRDTGKVIVENVTLNCAAGDEKQGACLTVSHTDKTGSLTVSGCELLPGDMQMGMLLVNVDKATVEGNRIKVRTKNKNQSFSQRLKKPGFLLSIRRQLLSGIQVAVQDSATAPIVRREDNIVAFAYDGRQVSFKTSPELVEPWREYITKNPLASGMTDVALTKALKVAADTIIKSPEAVDVVGFAPWVDVVKANLPATAAQGIVCAGRVANDIAITGNTIVGVTQGIHVGLSDQNLKAQEPFSVKRITLRDNRIDNYLTVLNRDNLHGIFIGNVDCAHLENNHLHKVNYAGKDEVGAGIRLYGYFGHLLQIRCNHTDGYYKGIYAKAIIESEGRKDLWQVENNFLALSTAPELIPSYKFIANNNVY